VSDIECAALLQGLDGFDRTSLREGAAALLLWPENADRHIALGRLVEALESSEAGGDAEIGREQWAAWLAGEGGTKLQAIQPDGYHDAPLCAQAVILGAASVLLAGQLEFPALHYRIWIEALADDEEHRLEAARELLIATVSLCDRVAGISKIGEHRCRAQGPASDNHSTGGGLPATASIAANRVRRSRGGEGSCPSPTQRGFGSLATAEQGGIGDVARRQSLATQRRRADPWTRPGSALATLAGRA